MLTTEITRVMLWCSEEFYTWCESWDILVGLQFELNK